MVIKAMNKKIMEYVLIGLISVGSFAGGFMWNNTLNEAPKQKQEINNQVKRMSTTTMKDKSKFEKVYATRQDIENVNTETTHHDDLKKIAKNKGLKEFKKIITYYSNGSTSIAYPQLEQYYFIPYEMGDYDYHFDNKATLNKAVETYISMKATGTY